MKNIEKVLEKINQELKANVDKAIIGLSGGADSTLVALLCKEALGADNVIGIHMPYGGLDENTFNNRSRKFALHIGIHSFIKQIKPTVDSLVTECMSKLIHGNTRARIRMTILYQTAGIVSEESPNKRVRVMNTCNLSESIPGYATKFGDSAGDISLIDDLFKSEVYALLDYFKERGDIIEEHIDRKPSAGLWVGQYDEEELGYTYAEMEKAIRYFKYNQESKPDVEVLKFVRDKYEANKHKMSMPPIVQLRDLIDN